MIPRDSGSEIKNRPGTNWLSIPISSFFFLFFEIGPEPLISYSISVREIRLRLKCPGLLLLITQRKGNKSNGPLDLWHIRMSPSMLKIIIRNVQNAST